MNQGTSEQQPKQPLEDPELGPTGARKPHPVDEPIEPKGSEARSPITFPASRAAICRSSGSCRIKAGLGRGVRASGRLASGALIEFQLSFPLP